jgi:catechol 2,3-dioxygenase-like lactoylglutathione lyase family enzyme
MFRIDRLDHLVLTVRELSRTIDFYTRVLGMEEQTFGAGRKALRFGRSKLNLHEVGREFEPKAAAPAAGSADLCFITGTPLPAVMAHLETCGVPLLLAPSTRTGALGPIESVYLRDPDGNLIEISNYAG